MRTWPGVALAFIVPMVFGVTRRGVVIVAGTGITATPADSTDGQQYWTVASTVTGGVSSVTGAGSTSCSPTSGAVTCTTSNTVSNGLTGVTTMPAHSYTLGEGTSAVGSCGPCTTGIACVGTTLDPACGTVVVGGGGTGQTSLTAHDLVVGNATSAVNFLAPGTSGNQVFSNGTDFVSAAPQINAICSNTGGVVALGTTATTVATCTVGAQVSGHVLLTAEFPELTAAHGPCGTGPYTIQYGYGVDTAGFTASAQVNVPDATTLSQLVAGGGFTATVSVAPGSHTITAVALTNGVASCNSAIGFVSAVALAL